MSSAFANDTLADLPAISAQRMLFAIPKKGRLYEHCLSLLQGADIQFHRRNRLDIAMSTNHALTLVFLPAADIPKFVGEGTVDLGITGQDMVAEAGASNIEEVLQLGFGRCSLCVQVPVSSGITDVKQLAGKRIVTSFENLASKYFKQRDAEAASNAATKISFVSGSVEAACALGLADGIIDLVESGETMRAAGLHSIATLLTSQAVLIANKASAHPELTNKIASRIRGVIIASKFLYCNYNVERAKLKQASAITPGRKAPTISPLDDPDWVAVSVMIAKSDSAEIMDALERLGAKDILVFNIGNCRV
ncbi:ATP phosphoribosyltransferase (ATP-PRTase) (ATP-PRT) [Sorochytrium milnesiophthora]